MIEWRQCLIELSDERGDKIIKGYIDDYVYRKVNDHHHSREWVTNDSVRIMNVRIRFSEIQMIGRE